MSGAPTLPPGWIAARLDELFATITDGDHQPPPQAQTGVPFVVIGDIRDGFVDLSDARFVPWTYYKSLPAPKKPLAGDLLYTVTGSFGIPVVVGADAPFCVQRHIAILKPDHATNVRYVALALSTNAALGQATAVATGTAQKTVGLARLRTITIPLAPTNEQLRIVGALDSLLSRLGAAVAGLQSAQRKLKAYRVSVLKAAVEGRLVPTEAELARREGRSYESADVLLDRILKDRRRRWEEAEFVRGTATGRTPRGDKWKAKYKELPLPDTHALPKLPEGWQWVTMGLLIRMQQNGLYVPASRYGRGVPILRIDDYQSDRSRSGAELKQVDISSDDAQKYGLRKNDIVLNRVNSMTHLGKAFVISERHIPAVFESNMMRIELLPGVSPHFVHLYLSSSLGRTRLTKNAKWAVNQASINQVDVASCAIPLPPFAEQLRIVAEVERLLSVASASADDLSASGKRCLALRQSVLSWAFAGKLVDQDVNDEPAEVLLAHIRAERAAVALASPKAKRSRKLKAAS